MKKTSIVMAALMLNACSLAPDYVRPDIKHGDAWQDEAATSDVIDVAWWKHFQSRDLDALVAQALAANNDLQAGVQRVEQARAQARIAGASLYPSASTGAGYRANNAEDSESQRSWSLDGSVSYEVDLWQRNRNTAQAALAQLEASRYDRDALALVLVSETVQRYAEILTYDERIRLTQNTIGIFKDTLQIVESRFAEGSSSGLEVAQQRATLANAEASLANLRQQRAMTTHALAVLQGYAPQDYKTDFKTTLKALSVPNVAPLQPSALLERRPDMRAREASLRAANANIGVARAALYPSMSLGLNAGLLANPATAAPAWSAGAAASLAQQIFAGGALRGQVALSEARQAELVESYRGAVLTSFREAQDALVTIQASATREKKLQTALRESRNAYQIAKDRYDSGAADFLSLLDAQRSLLSAQENEAVARLDRLNAALQLYKAMGGGWKS